MNERIFLVIGVGTVIAEAKEWRSEWQLLHPAIINKLFTPDGRVGFSLDPLLMPLFKTQPTHITLQKDQIVVEGEPNDQMLETYNRFRADQIRKDSGLIVPANPSGLKIVN